MFLHLTLVPFIEAAGELKSKPTQHSVRELREIGIQPDVLLCRTDRFLPKEIKSKIALFCNLAPEAVITARDVDTIYEVPVALQEEGLDDLIADHLDLGDRNLEMLRWQGSGQSVIWSCSAMGSIWSYREQGVPMRRSIYMQR